MAYIFRYGDSAGEFATGIAQAYGQQVAQAAQRRQALEQQSLSGQLEQAQGQLARTQEIGLRSALSQRERADQQAFTRERDAAEQANRLAAQANQFQLRQTADERERDLRRTQYGELIKRFPEMAQDPEAAIAELDYLEGRGLGTFQSIRARQQAAKAKQAEMAQRGEAAANLYDVSAPMPEGVLPADQAGPPTPEGQAGLARRGATMQMLRSDPGLIDNPAIRGQMGFRTPSEELAIDREGRLVNQEDRLNQSLDLQRQRLEMNKATRMLNDAQKRVMRLQNELIKTPEIIGETSPRRQQLLTELAKAESELAAVENAAAPFLTPNAGPGAGGARGAGAGQDGLGSPTPGAQNNVGEVGRLEDGRMVLQGPGGTQLAFTVEEAVALRARTAQRYGAQWASMNEQQRRAAMAELAELLHSGGGQ